MSQNSLDDVVGVAIKSLPVFGSELPEDLPALNRRIKPKGEQATISISPINYIAYIEFPKDGIPRANHFHEEKEEYLYLITGRVACYFRRAEMPSDPIQSVEVVAGDLIIIKPRWSHAYKTLEAGHAIEFSPTPFEIVAKDRIVDKII